MGSFQFFVSIYDNICNILIKSKKPPIKIIIPDEISICVLRHTYQLIFCTKMICLFPFHNVSSWSTNQHTNEIKNNLVHILHKTPYDKQIYLLHQNYILFNIGVSQTSANLNVCLFYMNIKIYVVYN